MAQEKTPPSAADPAKDAPIDALVSERLAQTKRLQGQAADPQASVWVSANAGTGKTHVLTNRVLRLLLAGSPPEKILCLTYTKAAAAEMSTRVFDKLAKWVTAGDAELRTSLQDLLERAPDDAELLAARQLFTRAIETPGGLKVQTIHAFCEKLLQRFPLEAGVQPGFKILDDALGARLKRDAVNTVLERAAGAPDTPLGQALLTAVAFAQEDRFDDVIAAAMGRRGFLDAVTRIESLDMDRDERDPIGPSLKAFEGLLRRTFCVADDASIDGLVAQQTGCLSRSSLQQIADRFFDGKSDDVKTAAAAAAALSSDQSPEACRDALQGLFLTKSGTCRKRLFNKGMEQDEPGLCDQLIAAQSTFHDAEQQLKALRGISATTALVRLAHDVMQTYTRAKQGRGVLDYDDLILKTGSLLSDTEEAAWVLYKLDGGLDHILVDESQDTAPEQWRIIEGLAREFFAGAGARDDIRTLFAVGDEKQSIYSFQGAAPEKFAQMGRAFRSSAVATGGIWRDLKLELSFRTTASVLAAVDQTFATPCVVSDLTSDPTQTIQHLVKRVGQAGLVEIWPTETPDAVAPASPWDPFAETNQEAPPIRLANRIADRIAHWLDSGERLESQDRCVRPSDILILVRKRTQFAGPMVAALKARGLPVAGSDRMDLSAQIAVQDLMALSAFLVLPEDDLALANVLKSPLVGFDDMKLFEIGHVTGEFGRRGTLWTALLARRATDDACSNAVERLISWRRKADFLPPFEFFSEVLDKDGGRRLLLDRLGAEAADPLDEFLNAAIQFDESEPPSLQGFLTWLGSGSRQIKRDMDQGADEIRVLTVHGAKGLEAPIVFLPDTCSTQSGGGASDTLVTLPAGKDWPEALASPSVWAVGGAKDLEAVKAAKSARDQRDKEERNRLLYVAMTRARDRLYVCGFESRKGRPEGCWYDLIDQALRPKAATVREADGQDILRLSEGQTAPPDPKAGAEPIAGRDVDEPRPGWAGRTAPAVQAPRVPIAPSQLAPFDHDEEGEPMRPQDAWLLDRQKRDAPAPDTPLDDAARFKRGTLTHALLQYLPDLPVEARRAAALSYLETSAREISQPQRSSIAAEVLGVLEDPDHAMLFAANSRAEALVSAVIPHPDGRGPELNVHGQIDRLYIGDDAVGIVDFKSNRRVPSAAKGVAEAYLLQLAAYRLCLQQIYPGRSVRCFLLWTAVPRLMEIPEPMLSARTSTLWDIKPANLDGPSPRS